MRAPSLETLAKAVSQDSPQMAVDLLRAGGYTKRAALRRVSEERGFIKGR